MDLGTLLTGGGIAALAGFVAAWWESKREHKRWLRDKRLEAYLSLAEVLSRHQAIITVTKGDVSDDVLYKALDEMHRPMTEVMLLGPDLMAKAATALINEFSELMQLKEKQRPDGIVRFKTLREGFLRAGANELSISPIPLRYRRKARKKLRDAYGLLLRNQHDVRVAERLRPPRA